MLGLGRRDDRLMLPGWSHSWRHSWCHILRLQGGDFLEDAVQVQWYRLLAWLLIWLLRRGN
jgi:hypothetical protein